MKAEHRKELQTNVLADRMGRLVQGMKTRPPRRAFVYVIAGVAVLVALVIFNNTRQSAAEELSRQWLMLEDGYKGYLDVLQSEHKDTNAGKAARFQYAWVLTWDVGLKRMAADPVQALDALDIAEKRYRQLAEECKDDPVWEPEALYAIAIIEESRAVHAETRDKHLEKALAMYKKLANEHKDSAHGKTARKRAQILEDKEKSKEVVNFYARLGAQLEVDKRLQDAAEIEKLKAKFKAGMK
jgi:hypothetical protein